MTPEQLTEWQAIVESCNGTLNSINVGSRIRRAAILAVDAELQRLQAIEAEYNNLKKSLTDSIVQTNARNRFLFGG